MDITKSGNIIKTNKVFNAQTVAYSLVYSIGLVVFLIIKQVLKGFGLSAGLVYFFAKKSLYLQKA